MVFFSHNCAGNRGLGVLRVFKGPKSPWAPKKKVDVQLTKLPAFCVTSSGTRIPMPEGAFKYRQIL
jgi:hypothetical protein